MINKKLHFLPKYVLGMIVLGYININGKDIGTPYLKWNRMMEQVNDNSIFSHISSYHFEYVPLRYWMGSFFSVYSDRNVHRTCILQYFITNFHEFLKWTYFLARKCSLTFVFTLSHVADNSFFFFFFFLRKRTDKIHGEFFQFYNNTYMS